MASILPWEQASASPQYKNASLEKQAQMRQQYIAAGGTIPEAAPQSQQPEGGVVSDFARGAAAGLENRYDAMTQGYREMGARSRADSSDSVLGAPLIRKEAQEELDQIKQEQEKTRSAYSQRMDQLGTAGKVGAMSASIGADIASLLIAPEVAIPALGVEAFGRAYGEQKEEDKSLANAGLVGAATFAANRILPGAVGQEGTTLLSRLGKNALSTGIAGAKGGAAIGAAEALNRNGDNTDIGDIAEGTVRGSGEGFLFGSAFGGAHTGINALLGKSTTTSPIFRDSSPEVRSSINDQATAIGEAPTSYDVRSAYDNAPDLRQAKALSAMEANGFRINDAAVRDNEAGQRILGTTQKKAVKSFTGADGSNFNPLLGNKGARPGKSNADLEHNQNIGRDFVKSNQDNIQDNIDALQGRLDSLKQDIEGDKVSGDFNTNTSDFNAITRDDQNFLDAYKAWSKDAKTMDSRGPKDMNAFLDKAQSLSDSYKNISPEFKAIVDNFKKSTGQSDVFDPIGDSHLFNDMSSALSKQDRGWKTVTSEGTNTKDSPMTNPFNLSNWGKWVGGKLKASARVRSRAIEQERNANTIRDLASSDLAVSRSRRSVEEARSEMDEPAVDPIPFENTPDPQRVAQEPTIEAPVTSVDPVLSRNLARSQLQSEARQRAVQEAQRQSENTPVDTVVEPSGPSPSELRSSARNDAAVSQHRADLERAKLEAEQPVTEKPETVPEVEAVPVDTKFNREQARAAFKKAAKREPTKQELDEAEALNNSNLVESLKERMDSIKDFARKVSKPSKQEKVEEPVQEAPVETKTPKDTSSQDLASSTRKVKGSQKVEEVKEHPQKSEGSPEDLLLVDRDGVISQRSRSDLKPEDKVLPQKEAPVEEVKPSPDQNIVKTPRNTATDIEKGFKAISEGLGDSVLNRVVEKGGLVLSKPESIKMVKDNPDKYSYKENGDGTITLLGGKDSKGDWVGERNPETPVDSVKNESEPLPVESPKRVVKSELEPVKPQKGALITNAMDSAKRKMYELRMNRFAKTLATPEVRAKATLENMYASNKHYKQFLRDLASEDKAADLERHAEIAKRQLEASAKLKAAKNSIIRQLFSDWLKGKYIPANLVEEALKKEQNGEGGNVGNLDALIKRVTNLNQKRLDSEYNKMVEDAYAEDSRLFPEQKGPSLKDQKEEMVDQMNVLLKDELMSPQQKDAVKQVMSEHIDNTFKSSEKAGREEGLETGQMRDIWEKFFNEYNRRAGTFLKANKDTQYRMASDAVEARKKRFEEAVSKRKASLEAREKREGDKLTLQGIASQRAEIEKMVDKLPEAIRDTQKRRVIRQLEVHHNRGRMMAPERYRNMIESITNAETTHIDKEARNYQELIDDAIRRHDKMVEDAFEMDRKYEAAKRESRRKEDKEADERQNNLMAVQRQRDDIRGRVEKQFEGTDVPAEKREDFINSYMDSKYSLLENPMSPADWQNARSRIERDVNQYSKGFKDMSEAEQEIASATGTTEAISPEVYGEKVSKAVDEVRATDAEVKNLQEEEQAFTKARESMQGEERADVEEALTEAMKKSQEDFVSKVESAFKDNKDLNQLVKIAEIMDRVHGADLTGNNRRFVNVLKTAAKNKELYGDNPAAWIGSEDYSEIAKLGRGSAGGNKTRALEKIFRTNADEAQRKLLGPDAVIKLRKVIKKNPDERIPKYSVSDRKDYMEFLEGFNSDGTPKNLGALRKSSAREKLPKRLRVAPKKVE